jgi:hypothetical protein
MKHLVSGKQTHGSEKDTPPDDNAGSVHGEMPKSAPQSKAFRPHVDVSNKQPPKVLQEKKASHYAFPSEQKYPLDSYTQVQAAAQYYEKYASAFSPDERREYCLNLSKRASDLNIPVSGEITQYGATTYAEPETLKVGYQLRKQLVGNIEDMALLLDTLYEKRASVDPELFAATLHEFDKVAHIDFNYGSAIPDQYASTFGQKVAEAWSEVIGNDVVSERDLVRLGKIGIRALRSTFSDDFAEEFRKNPVAIFKSLPLDQKKIVMRMATDNGGPGIELTS